MSKNIIMGYRFEGWTHLNLISYLRQEFLKRNLNVEQTNSNSLKIKKGDLLLWEGFATVTAYNRGEYIELLISSSETRSFLTGGLIGKKKAVEARKTLINTILNILGQPAYIKEI